MTITDEERLMYQVMKEILAQLLFLCYTELAAIDAPRLDGAVQSELGDNTPLVIPRTQKYMANREGYFAENCGGRR